MSRFFKVSGLAIYVLLAAIIAACSSPPEPKLSSETPTNGLVQSSAAGEVTIDVEWMGEENNKLIFYVSMDTHSVDLDRYDLGKLAVLRADGSKEYRPISWDSAPGGHHRGGTLAFPLPESLNQAKYLELLIRDVAGVKERVLKWNL